MKINNQILLILLLLVLLSLPILYADQSEIFEGILVFGNASGLIASGGNISGGGVISNDSLDETYLNLSGTNADQMVNIHPQRLVAGALNITNETGTIAIFVTEDGFVGIGSDDTSHELDVHGHVEIEHVADETGDHALQLDVDTGAFGDVKALFIDFDTGAIIAEQDESIIFLNVDQFTALGGAITGFEMVTTEGSATLTGLQVGIQISPVRQLSGIFGDMDSVNISNGTNGLAAFTSQTTNITIFDVDDYTVTLGNDVTFQEIEVILEVDAGGGGIKPVFYHSTGVDTWSEFAPSDGTSGFRDTGVIIWEDSDVPDWEVGFNSEFLIRINRTANNIPTAPVELLIQVSDTTEFFWDLNGDILINKINASDWSNLTTLLADDFILRNGSSPLTGDWDAGSFIITALNYISDVSTGTQPYATTSTTKNTNLNADLLDGKDIGTSGNVIPLLDQPNLFSANQRMETDSDWQFRDANQRIFSRDTDDFVFDTNTNLIFNVTNDDVKINSTGLTVLNLISGDNLTINGKIIVDGDNSVDTTSFIGPSPLGITDSDARDRLVISKLKTDATAGSLRNALIVSNINESTGEDATTTFGSNVFVIIAEGHNANLTRSDSVGGAVGSRIGVKHGGEGRIELATGLASMGCEITREKEGNITICAGMMVEAIDGSDGGGGIDIARSLWIKNATGNIRNASQGIYIEEMTNLDDKEIMLLGGGAIFFNADAVSTEFISSETTGHIDINASVSIDLNSNIVATDGSVGIGTTDPTSPLHILADSDADNILLEENFGGENWTIGIGVIGNLNFKNSGVISAVFQDGEAFIFGASINPSGAVMHIEKGGTTDNARLSLSRSTAAANSNVSIDFRAESVLNDLIGRLRVVTPNPTTSDVIIEARAGSALFTHSTFETDGDLGIGTTNPTHTLNVIGDANITVFGAATATTVCQNGGVLSACSSRTDLKENITDLPIGTALDIISLLQPKRFNFIDNREGRIGFLAEDVIAIDPRLTFNSSIPIYNYTNFSFTDFDGSEQVEVIRKIIGYKSELGGVNYRQEIVTLNVQAIQELNSLIQTQQTEIALIKTELCNRDPTYSWCR